jgi:chromosome segregation ATPase
MDSQEYRRRSTRSCSRARTTYYDSPEDIPSSPERNRRRSTSKPRFPRQNVVDDENSGSKNIRKIKVKISNSKEAQATKSVSSLTHPLKTNDVDRPDNTQSGKKVPEVVKKELETLEKYEEVAEARNAVAKLEEQVQFLEELIQHHDQKLSKLKELLEGKTRENALLSSY